MDTDLDQADSFAEAMEFLDEVTGPQAEEPEVEQEQPVDEHEGEVEQEQPEEPEVDEEPEEEDPFADIDPEDTAAWREAARQAEKRRRDLQSYNEKRFREQQQQMQQHMAQMQQQMAMQMQQQPNQQAEVTREDFEAAITNDPVNAFVWIRGNRPDLLETAFQTIQEIHGEGPANEAMMVHQQLLTREQLAATNQRIEEMQAPEIINNGLTDMLTEISGQMGEEEFEAIAPELRDRIASYAQQGMSLNGASPQEVWYFLNNEIIDIQKAHLAELRNNPGPRKVDTASLGEKGGGTRPSVTPDDSLVNEIVDAFNEQKFGSMDLA